MREKISKHTPPTGFVFAQHTHIILINWQKEILIEMLSVNARISRVRKEHFAVFFCHTKLTARTQRLSSVPLLQSVLAQHPLKYHQLSEANWVMCAKRNSKLIKLICAHRGKERAAINSNLRLLFALAVSLSRSHYFSWKRWLPLRLFSIVKLMRRT